MAVKLKHCIKEYCYLLLVSDVGYAQNLLALQQFYYELPKISEAELIPVSTLKFIWETILKTTAYSKLNFEQQE